MRRRVLQWVSLLLALLLLTACAKDSTPQTKDPANEEGLSHYQFKDATGATVSLPKKPVRVAVLFSSFADVWHLAGGEVAITVGESVERGFATADVLLVDAGAGKAINTELLISYEPDFVIASADIAAQVEAVSLLRDAKIPAALFRVESFSDYLRMLRICTDITQQPARYEQYGSTQEEQLHTLMKTVTPPSPRLRYLFIRAGSTAQSTKAKTADEHFACGMLAELGAINIADRAPVLLDGLSIEAILAEDPDIIFITCMGNEATSRAYVESMFADEAWQALSAVQNGRYYFLSKDLFQYKPNARWCEAYSTLAELLYGKTS